MSAKEHLRLVLIEDNRGDARYLEELLREAAVIETRAPDRGTVIEGTSSLRHVSTLSAGIDALTPEVDIVLLDLDLPGIDGMESLRRIIERSNAPVVALSDRDDRGRGVEAIRIGADDYLVKSEISSDLLIRSIYHAIERQEHARELRKYESLIERSTDVNAILDPDGVIRYITPSVETVLGYERNELVGENAVEFVHPDDASPVEQSLDRVISEEDIPPQEFRIEHADGSWVVLESRARNLLDDPLIEGIVVYTRDVTDRVARERKLKRFSRVVSHDLQNPLTIAQMYVSSYRREGREEDLERVERSLDRMDHLIDTLLELAEEGDTIDERVEVSIQSIVTTAWRHVDTGSAKLRIESPGTVYADPERLQTVLENLIRNACEHGGDDIDIRIQRVDRGFAVEDDGSGIDPDLRDSIFEFGVSGGQGTGSGLAIVREIVEAHGWEINAGDGADGGARFEITGIDQMQ